MFNNNGFTPKPSIPFAKAFGIASFVDVFDD